MLGFDFITFRPSKFYSFKAFFPAVSIDIEKIVKSGLFYMLLKPCKNNSCLYRELPGYGIIESEVIIFVHSIRYMALTMFSSSKEYSFRNSVVQPAKYGVFGR